MIIIRPITCRDLPVFAEFSFDSLLGMTNLPRSREKLNEKILHSEASFLKPVDHQAKEEYYFVLEDLTTGRIGGVCGILAKSSVGFSYFYKIGSLSNRSKSSFVPSSIPILKPVKNRGNTSEICSLYLQPTFRHGGQGRLLSLSRFLFIAAYRCRFQRKIVAEMRGYIDQRQISPFWNSIGRHFCNLSFLELMTQLEENLSFIPDILPPYPIYINLLPQEAQEAIGKIHEQTKPALNMLLKENFTYHNEIDLFEGGPILSASTSYIRSVKNSQLIQIETTKELLAEEEDYILANEKLVDFRACFGKMQLISKNQGLINEEVAKALLIQSGDKVRYVTLH